MTMCLTGSKSISWLFNFYLHETQTLNQTISVDLEPHWHNWITNNSQRHKSSLALQCAVVGSESTSSALLNGHRCFNCQVANRVGAGEREREKESGQWQSAPGVRCQVSESKTEKWKWHLWESKCQTTQVNSLSCSQKEDVRKKRLSFTTNIKKYKYPLQALYAGFNKKPTGLSVAWVIFKCWIMHMARTLYVMQCRGFGFISRENALLEFEGFHNELLKFSYWVHVVCRSHSLQLNFH